MNKRIIVGTIAIVSFLVSCQKADMDAVISETNIVEATSNVKIMSPYENQVFKKGDTVLLNASIHAEIEMHGYEMSLTTSTGDIIYTNAEHSHGTEININTFWVNNLTEANDITLHITAVADHEGNEISSNLIFKTE